MLGVVRLAAADQSTDQQVLEVIPVDDEADEVVAAKVAATLAEDPRVLAVVGHKNSGPSKAAAPVYAAAGLIQVLQCATDDALTYAGYSTVFRLCAGNQRQASAAASYAATNLRSRRAVAVHDGTDYGQPLVEAFAREFHRLASQSALVLSMHVGQEDFTELCDQVRRAGPDLVYLGATEIEGSKLTKALRSAGVGAQVMTSEGGPHNPYPRLAGPPAEGTVHTYAGVDPSATEAARKLTERCRRELGEVPSFAVECYDAVTVIATAVAQGAQSRRALRDAVAHVDVEGLAGPIRFDAFGDRVDAPVSMWRVEDGRMVPLAEAALP